MTKHFNLVEAEGLQDVWDEIPEPNPDPRAVIFPDISRCDERWETQPDDYICWRGCWIGDSLLTLSN